jgi:hypothetical protein
MGISGGVVVERFSAAGLALSGLPSKVADYRALDEAVLLAINAECATLERRLGAARAAIAGEIAHRSRPALGSAGLAQRTGHRTPELFLKHTTGATKQQVDTVLEAGVLLSEMADAGSVDPATGEILEPTRPWLRPAVVAVAAGEVSLSVLQSIGAGLGTPNSAVTGAQLETATVALVAEAIAGVDADRVFRRAREARDDLDVAGVKVREEERRQQRSLTVTPLPTGMVRLVWVMDPETGALVKDLYDRAVSPKRGGVRFVNPARAERAKMIFDDGRTAAQYASDAFLQLLIHGADADTRLLVGSGAPVIRITVTETALVSGVGVGRIDGVADPVSIDTVERLLCGGTSIRMGFDLNGNVLDVEREQRLYSRRQREVLAVRFGGCMDPECERPPSWCEAHHIAHVHRDGGKTVIDNGILLCRWHHLKYHNQGWEIEHDRHGRYWLIPPASIDPAQTPRLMTPKNAALRDLAVAVG